MAAFDLLEQEPERVERLWDNTRYFQQALRAQGFDTGVSESPITPIFVGEAKIAHEFSAALFAAGLWATGIGFPTVPKGKARIRTIVTSEHSAGQLDQAVLTISSVAAAMGIPRP